MLRHPPEILVTTPESLNVLLTSRRGRVFLSGVETVILDEVHAVAGTKRGALLAAGVERLAREAGEFQRIALSATVRPLERIAAWVGGARISPGGAATPRPVAIVRSTEPKRYRISVGFPDAREEPPGAPPLPEVSSEALPFWRATAAELGEPLRRNRSTLVFANSKRMVEKLTRLVNDAAGEQIVYSHHGSLSREVRRVVEERLKRGELRGIVATNSLELGIDIGSLDEVVLAQTPPSLASAAQRIGRAGHAVGGTSRGRFLPLHPRDLLDSAAAARAVLDGEIEPVRPVEGPLDVLAQSILSMVATETWRIDELWDTVRGADPFRNLARRPFDLVIEMLAGRFASARVRPLRPLVLIDRDDGTVRGLPGAERLVYMGGRHDPGPRLLPPAARRDAGAPRRARRGVRVGAVGGRHLHARRAGVAHRADHPQRRARLAGPRGRGDVPLLAGRRARPRVRAVRAGRPAPRGGGRGSRRPGVRGAPRVALPARARRRARAAGVPEGAAGRARRRPPPPAPRGDREDRGSGLCLRPGDPPHALGRARPPAAGARPRRRVGSAARGAGRDRARRRLRRGARLRRGRSRRAAFAPLRRIDRAARPRASRGHRVLRRALPRGGRRRAAAAEGRVQAAHPALALAPAGQGAVRRDEPLRRLPGPPRGVARVPRRRVRPRAGSSVSSTRSATAASRCASSPRPTRRRSPRG